MKSLLMASGAPRNAIYSRYSSAMPDRHAVVVTVGSSRDYSTVNGAITAASAMLSGSQRALVVIDPGTYVEQVGTYERVDIAGSTGNPADVTIANTCPTGFSPLNTNGGPLWIGGITAKLLSYPDRVGTGVYSIHHHGGSMTIFERVILDSEEGLGSIGMDGDGGSATWLIGCTIRNHVADTGLATNMHGTGSNTSPLRLVFDDCETEGLGVNYNGLGSGQADEFYVQGGSVARVNIQGAGVVGHIDPAIPDVVASTGAVAIRDTMLPSRPLRGA